MELLEMFPIRSSFEIEIKGQKRKIRLRKISLKDHLWCNGHFKQEIASVLSASIYDLDRVCELVYRQVVQEDKVFLENHTLEFIDENGNKKLQKVTGDRLLSILIQDEIKLQEVLDAYTLCFKNSNPIEEKKKPFWKTLLKI